MDRPVRELRLLGRTPDGAALVLQAGDERFVLRTDDDVLAALGVTYETPAQTARVAPREIQERIRRGESAAGIALSSGMELAEVARWEGPPLDERRFQLAQAGAATLRGRTLQEIVSSLDAGTGEAPQWDAWLDDTAPGAEPVWRITVTWPTGRSAVWRWRAVAKLLQPLDALARSLTDDEPTDLLDAVLRPVAGGAGADSRSGVTQLLSPQPPPQPRAKGRRAAVPSWEEITSRGPGPG